MKKTHNINFLLQTKKKEYTRYFVFSVPILLAVMLFLIPLFTKNYDETHIENSYRTPSLSHWLGTDYLGRDLLLRILLGLRLSLAIALISSLIDFILGIIWGTLAALSSPKIDTCLMKFADILYSVPYLLMVIMLMVIFQNSFFSLIIALSLTGWINVARMVRNEFLNLKNKNYVLTAKTLGAGPVYLVFKHLLPNSIEPILSTMMLSVPSIIYSEAFLSFLGLGIQPPQASLGSLVKEGIPAMLYYPWQFLPPVIITGMLILSFNHAGKKLSKKIKQVS